MRRIRTLFTYVFQLAITLALSYIVGIVIWVVVEELIGLLVSTETHSEMIDLYFEFRIDLWVAFIMLPLFIGLMRKHFLFWRGLAVHQSK